MTEAEWYWKQIWQGERCNSNGDRKDGWYNQAIYNKTTVYVASGKDMGKRGIIQSYRNASGIIFLSIMFEGDIIATSIIESAVVKNLQQLTPDSKTIS